MRAEKGTTFLRGKEERAVYSHPHLPTEETPNLLSWSAFGALAQGVTELKIRHPGSVLRFIQVLLRPLQQVTHLVSGREEKWGLKTHPQPLDKPWCPTYTHTVSYTHSDLHTYTHIYSGLHTYHTHTNSVLCTHSVLHTHIQCPTHTPHTHI